MTDSVKELIERLKAAAEKATPGPWEHLEYTVDQGYIEAGGDAVLVFSWLREDDHVIIPYDNAENNGDYIELSQPKNITTLCDSYLALAESEAALRERVGELEAGLLMALHMISTGIGDGYIFGQWDEYAAYDELCALLGVSHEDPLPEVLPARQALEAKS